MEQYRFNDIFVSENKKLLEKYVVELDISAYRRYFDIWVQIEETQILVCKTKLKNGIFLDKFWQFVFECFF